MKTIHLEDNWKGFSMAIEERFTDRQEHEKDHEKLWLSNTRATCKPTAPSSTSSTAESAYWDRL